MSSPPTLPDSITPPAPTAASSRPAVNPAKSNTTPIKQNSQGTERYTTKSKIKADELHIDMARELAGQWVGPMPVQKFLEAFVPLPKGLASNSMPEFKDDFFGSLPHHKEENKMYDPFMAAITASNTMPEFQLVKTAYNPDVKMPVARRGKPDIAVYKKDLDLGIRLTRFEEMELLFELKPPTAPADPFDDDAKKKKGVLHPFEAKSTDDDVHNLREKCRGQIACYATTWCSRQHRTHCFIIWMGDPDARIIRFDRSGAIVSAKFNYRTQSKFLLEFFWRFSNATEAVRGHDTTVSFASAEESRIAKAALQEWAPAAAIINRWHVLKMQIPDAVHGTRSVFVWKPLAEPLSVTGRATRGYPGWDPLGDDGKGAVVFVKDSWRSCEEGMEKESAIIKDLNDKGCRYVPVLIRGDDIPEQFTETKQYASEKWNLGGRAGSIVARVHTRFAQDFVGYPLETFETSRQLILAIYQALLAHRDAYEKCGILHRDISAGNILLRKGGGGILNDWDLAKRVDRDPNARQPYRSGTWQYMSAALLLEPGKINTVQDDMESIFWLTLYYVLRYMDHNKLLKVRSIMESIFDEEHQTTPDTPVCGGRGKQAVFVSRSHIEFDFTIEGNKPLTILIRVLINHWSDWYTSHLSNKAKIADTILLQGLSEEEAAKLHPFDAQSLPMSSYKTTVELFEAALSMEQWPPADLACDRLPQKKSRKLAAIYEDEDEDEGPADLDDEDASATQPATRPTKKLRTSQRLNDDAPYQPTPGTKLDPITISFGSREGLRSQARPPNYTEVDSDEDSTGAGDRRE